MPSLQSSRSLTQVCFSLLLARVTKIYKYKQSDKPIEMKMFSRRSLKKQLSWMLTRLASCGRAWQLLPPLPPSRPCSPPPPPPHPSTPPPPRWSVSTTKIKPKPQSPTTLIPLSSRQLNTWSPSKLKVTSKSYLHITFNFFSSIKRQKHQLCCPDSRQNCLFLTIRAQ